MSRRRRKSARRTRRDTGGGLYRRRILSKLRNINEKQGELIESMLHTPEFISLIDYKKK